MSTNSFLNAEAALLVADNLNKSSFTEHRTASRSADLQWSVHGRWLDPSCMNGDQKAAILTTLASRRMRAFTEDRAGVCGAKALIINALSELIIRQDEIRDDAKSALSCRHALCS